MPTLLQKPRGKPYLEVQVHPSDIRRGVWYLFLSQLQIRGMQALAVIVCLFVLFSAAIAPQVIGNFLSRKEYIALMGERTQQGERLEVLTTQLKEIETESDQLHLAMNRIYVAYGLSHDLSIGQGGFPRETESVPDSIYHAKIQHTLTLRGGLEQDMRVLGTFVQEIQDFEEAHRDQVTSTPSIHPLRGGEFVLTSPYGTRRSPFTKEIDFHAGIDLAAPTGTPIFAPADGTVVFAGRYPLKQSVGWWRYGNMVSMRHGSQFVTIFGHCDEVTVRNGQRVEQGELIGTVGNTGWSTSSHLHYEVRRFEDEAADFRPVDPRIYILDHKWRDEERLLVRARSAPDARNFEPLPRLFERR